MVLSRESTAQTRYGDNLIVALGDSRLGITPKLCNDLEPETGYFFRSAGVAGTDPRAWYYMLRDLDPTARRYRAILLTVNSYDDEEDFSHPDDDIRALHFAIARLRLTDVISFALSFHSAVVKWQAFRGALLKGLVYQADFQDFLSNPKKRLHDVRINRRFFETGTYGYLPPDKTMQGVAIDWKTLTASFPADADENQRGTTEAVALRPPAPQTGRFAAYRRLWFGQIVNRYATSPTKIVFLRLARGPFPRPDYLSRATTSSIREFSARPNVLLCDEHAFESLERPELFGDAVHLNGIGAQRFSRMLAEKIGAVLGAPK
jgi:hypothetical protein